MAFGGGVYGGRAPAVIPDWRGGLLQLSSWVTGVCARSLVTLRYIEGRLYLDPIRECYEAFVIYNFYMFLIAYLEVRGQAAL